VERALAISLATFDVLLILVAAFPLVGTHEEGGGWENYLKIRRSTYAKDSGEGSDNVESDEVGTAPFAGSGVIIPDISIVCPFGHVLRIVFV